MRERETVSYPSESTSPQSWSGTASVLVQKKSSTVTFPVVVSVDVKCVQQLVVVVRQEVQTSGPRLNDANDLMMS